METFSLKTCFIFSPFLKPTNQKPSDQDIQEAKLLLYYPKNVEKSIQLSNIGIIEGTLSFLQSFDNNENNQILITELNSSYSISKLFEDKFYFVLQLEKRVVGLSEFNKISNKNHWLECLIENVYDLFYLFHGDFYSNFFPNGKDIRMDQIAYNNIIVKLNDFLICYFEYLANITTPFIDNVLYANNTSYILNVIFSTLRLNEKMGQVEKIAIAYKGRILYNEIDISALTLLYNLFFSTDSREKFDQFRSPPFKEMNRQRNENDPEQYTFVTVDDKGFKECISPFMKAFEIPKEEDKGYLIGLKVLDDESKYHIFIPTINIKNLKQQYKLMVYFYKEMCFFMLLSMTFNHNDIAAINQIARNIHDFYGNVIQKIASSHQCFLSNALIPSYQYIYCNVDNHKLFFSTLSQIWKNDKERSKLILNIYEMIFPSPPTIYESSVTKFRDNYVYYTSFLEKRYVIMLKEFVSKETLKIKYIAEINDKMAYV